MLHYFPHTRDIIRVIPHGSEQALATAEHEPSMPLDTNAITPFILCPGSVEKRKNGERLIEAVELSRCVQERRIHLVFAGGMGYDHESIRRRAAASPLAEKIHFFTGLSSRSLQALYKSALFTIYPSVFEGFGLPIVEAFALGSPLITANIGAMAEVAAEAALTVDPYSRKHQRSNRQIRRQRTSARRIPRERRAPRTPLQLERCGSADARCVSGVKIMTYDMFPSLTSSNCSIFA